MSETGKERLYQELDNFVATRLRPFPDLYTYPYYYEYIESENDLNAEERLTFINERTKHGYSFSKFTNHEICHEMFWNAFRGHSRMYIQVPNLNSEENTFFNYSDRSADAKSKGEEDTITLSCTLLTLQMLDYDTMMFRAMTDQGNREYRNAAIKHYRPYLFNYVAEINQGKFKILQKKQQELWKYNTTLENTLLDARDEPYLWLSCTFNLDTREPSLVDLDGYIVQSASAINKIEAKLRIIEDDGIPVKVKKDILDRYNLNSSCMPDDKFINELRCRLDGLSSIYVYRIGNGNCVYAESKNKDKSFFYDIGFNHKHRPKKLLTKSTYNYSSAVQKMLANDPSFFILSHWDLDHIAGSFAAKKAFLDKKWFVPDCYDACTDAQRLAKYLDLKGNLFRVERKNGRLIGEIHAGNNITYKLFIGEKAPCDSSFPNCEGIVIKYEDTDNTVMMMGDVNYASFNKAIKNHNRSISSPIMPEPLFADTQIDYLIVPHHGSEHTDYNLIVGSKPITKGTEAIICCTDDADNNRPNESHKEKLEERFTVSTTESDAQLNDYIEIQL